MKISQRGWSTFGMLVFIVVAAAGGYYAYKAISGPDEAPSCASAFNYCMKSCRRTTTEAPATQACQEACQRDQAACERQGR
jgi:hypothetical protein